MAVAGAIAGAEIKVKVEAGINNFGSATLVFTAFDEAFQTKLNEDLNRYFYSRSQKSELISVFEKLTSPSSAQ